MRKSVFSKKIAILGAGSWGTSLGVTFATRHQVCLWEYDAAQARRLQQEGRNRIFLPMVDLPPNLTATNNMEEAITDADVVVFAVPSHVFRATAAQAAQYIDRSQYAVSVTKGVEQDTLLRMSEVLQQCIPQLKKIVALSGPTHAEEVALRVPTAIVAASRKVRYAMSIQRLFMTPWFRIYTSRDMTGVEIGGALKNVIAIAAGICDGMNFGDNTKAALITRGLAEISRLGVKMGARLETFSGLSGVGDLIVTCMSKYSRNRKVGMMLGHGRSLEDILRDMKQVAEGVKNTKSALALAKKHHAEMPIAAAVGAILFRNMPVKELGQLLMTRSAKQEFYK